jgi:vancomycin resistance protein VanJ
MRRFLLAACRTLAVAYPLALVLLIACLRLIGERWWGTTVALYLPRWLFGLPVAPLIIFIIWRGPRSLLWCQVAAVALLLPLFGFHVTFPQAAVDGGLRLRLVSCNIDAGAAGNDSILAMLRSVKADIIVLQAVHPEQYEALRAGLPGYNTQVVGQFWIASRFQVSQMYQPPKIQNRGFERSPRFARFQLETPLGPVIIYDVHPISPRDGFEDMRGQGLRARTTVEANTQLRLAQVRAIAEDAQQAPYPVVIAGDTNLPELSWAFADLLGRYQEGFSEAGNGFGYTFPAPLHPWLRIDRILADARWRFLDFQVIRAPVSDHFAVFADLQLKSP